MPAELTRMSGAPKVSMISVAARSDGDRVGQVDADPVGLGACGPELGDGLVEWSWLAGEHYHWAPAPAKALAMPLPMPELPPVTTATLPSSEKSECR